MDNSITANELKVKGVSVLDRITAVHGEAVITVRGREKYIVLTVDEYNRLRDCELEVALSESQRDVRDGRIHSGSVDEHLKRISHG